MQDMEHSIAEHVLCCSSCYRLFASALLDLAGRCPECSRSGADLPQGVRIW